MPIYKVKAPDGVIYDVQGPPNADPDKLIQTLKEHLLFAPQPIPDAPKDEAGFWSSFKEAYKQPFALSDEAAAYAANPTEENRKAFLEASESQYQSHGFGEGHNLDAFLQMAGGSLGSMAAAATAATAGTLTAGPVAGLAAGATTFTAQHTIDNLLRQAEEGKTEDDVKVAKALVAGAGQAVIDQAIPGVVFKNAFRKIPVLKNLVMPESKEVGAKAAADVVEAFQKGDLTFGKAVTKGVVKGVAFEAPTEVVQQVLERWQAGLNINAFEDPQARSEYYQSAIGGALLGGAFGGVLGPMDSARDTAKARQAIAEAKQEKEQEQAAGTMPPPPAEAVEQAEPPMTAPPTAGPTDQAAPTATDVEQAAPPTAPTVPHPQALGAAEDVVSNIEQDGISPDEVEQLNQIANSLGIQPSQDPNETLQAVKDLLNQQGVDEEEDTGTEDEVVDQDQDIGFNAASAEGDQDANTDIVGQADTSTGGEGAEGSIPVLRAGASDTTTGGGTESGRTRRKSKKSDTKGVEDTSEAAEAIDEGTGEEQDTLEETEPVLPKGVAKKIIDILRSGGTEADIAAAFGITNAQARDLLADLEQTQHVESTPTALSALKKLKKNKQTSLSDRLKFLKEKNLSPADDLKTKEYQDAIADVSNQIEEEKKKSGESDRTYKVTNKGKEYVLAKGTDVFDTTDSVLLKLADKGSSREEMQQVVGRATQKLGERHDPIKLNKRITALRDKGHVKISNTGDVSITEQGKAELNKIEKRRTAARPKQMGAVYGSQFSNYEHGLARLGIKDASTIRLTKEQQAQIDAAKKEAGVSTTTETAAERDEINRIIAGHNATGRAAIERGNKRRESTSRGRKAKSISFNSLARVVSTLLKKWKNAPNIQVYETMEELLNNEQFSEDINPNAKGFYDPKTKTVYLIAENIANEGAAMATIFHESLGHYGLHQAFGKELNKRLIQLYQGNKVLKRLTDQWLKQNPAAYAELSPADRLVRGAEEVLANLSENGELSKSSVFDDVVAALSDVVNKFLRAMGLSEFQLNPNDSADVEELVKFLQEAHEAVLSGTPKEATTKDTGIRYSIGATDDMPATPEPNTNYKFADSAYQQFLQKILQRYPGHPTATTTVNILSNLPRNLHKVVNSGLTMFNLDRMYSEYAPSISKLLHQMTAMAKSKWDMLSEYTKNYVEFSKVLQKVPPQERKGFNKFFTLLGRHQPTGMFTRNDTVYNEDPQIEKWVKYIESTGYDAWSKLPTTTIEEKVLFKTAQAYYAMSPELRKTARDLLGYYRRLGDLYFKDTLVKQLQYIRDKDTRQHIYKQIVGTRLEYYTPNMRTGVYKLVYYKDVYGSKDKYMHAEHFKSLAALKLARSQLEAQGATQFEESFVPELSRDTKLAPTGLLGEVLAKIKEAQGLTEEQKNSMSAEELAAHDARMTSITDAVYAGFVEFMPNKLKGEAKGRARFETEEEGVVYGVMGFNEDVLDVMQTYTPNLIYQINSLKWANELDDTYSEINKELLTAVSSGKTPIDEGRARDILASIRSRIDFAKKPTYKPYVNFLAKVNYYWGIAGNISSALVNTTILPMMVYPALRARYGDAKAFKYMSEATKIYAAFRKLDRDETAFKLETINGQEISKLDMNSKAVKEFKATMERLGVEKLGATPDQMVEYYKYLFENSAVGINAIQDMQDELRKPGMEQSLGLINKAAGLAFKETEQFNRGITHLSSFLLKMDSLRDSSDDAAKVFNRAAHESFIFNGEMNGSALHETSSQLFQTSIGRVLLTFRTFPMNMMIQVATTAKKMFKKYNLNDAERAVARKQLLGIYGMAFLFAGMKGVPLFGAIEWLASLLMSDDDEPYDMQQEILEAYGEIGLNGPLSNWLNINLADRTGFNGLLWRDDPKRLSEVGFVTYYAERLGGPTVGLAQNMVKGYDYIKQGKWDRGLEYMSPAAIRNGLKSWRFMTDGANDPSGNPIKEDPGAYSLAMQFLGFSPMDIAMEQSQRAVTSRTSALLEQRKSALLSNIFIARKSGDAEAEAEAMDAFYKFRESNPEIVKDNTLSRSMALREKAYRNAANGMSNLTPSQQRAVARYVADLDGE